MNTRVVLLIGICVIALGGLFFLLSPKDAAQPTTNTTTSMTAIPSKSGSSDKLITLVIKNNNLFSGENVITLSEGDNLILTVTSDTDDALHIHGYDKEVELQKGVPIQVMLKANLTGRFPIELHTAETEIAVLEVQPNQ